MIAIPILTNRHVLGAEPFTAPVEDFFETVVEGQPPAEATLTGVGLMLVPGEDGVGELVVELTVDPLDETRD
jgi:hypothetical protein